IKLAEERISGYRNFCNKLWNASRFLFLTLEGYEGSCALEDCGERSMADRWILSRVNETCRQVNRCLEDYKFNDAASALYKFVWNEFCDWYIELSKARLQTQTGPGKRATQNVMAHVLETALRLLHPFMPFITEEIWQQLPKEGKSVMTAPFPRYDASRYDAEAETNMNFVMEAVSGVRNIRGEMNLNPGLSLNLLIKTKDQETAETVNRHAAYIKEAGKIGQLTAGPSVTKPPISASSVLDGMDIIVPLEGLMDFAEEKKRIEKELKKIEKDRIFLERKLSNQEFVKNAPSEVIEKDEQRRQALSEKQDKLFAHLKTVEQALKQS
ncbi:MAG: class I tRNA ligase family protein, partial [Nitrospinae bacterium]|nr:class I tRNA ligase family protein [Nitrospinota bacterium]